MSSAQCLSLREPEPEPEPDPMGPDIVCPLPAMAAAAAAAAHAAYNELEAVQGDRQETSLHTKTDQDRSAALACEQIGRGSG